MLNSQQRKPFPIKEPLPTLSKLPPTITISPTSSVSLTHSASQPPQLYLQNMRSGASSYHRYEDTHRQPHFLDSCFLCRKPLSQKSDIYMYRGNTPFCSQECRQEQIATDEANGKRLKLSSSKRSSNTVRQNTESEKEFDSNKSVQSNTVSVS